MAEKVRTGHNIKVLTQTLHRVPRNLITTKQIKALDDLKGMKIRVPENPAYVEVWKELKSSPSPMGWGEVYTAMQQGVIEGAESPTDILFDSKLSEVAKYLTQTEHIRATGSLIINDKTFQALPDDLKKIMEEAALEAEKFNDEEFKKVDKEAIEKMKAAGVTITQLNSDDFRNAIKDLPQKLEEKNIWPKGLYEKIQSVK